MTIALAHLVLATTGCSKDANDDPTGVPPAVRTDCGVASPSALAACVERARYVADLEFIAAERPSESAHWQAVQDLCAQRLGEYGYQVERQSYATGVNVVGTRSGSRSGPTIVVGAHYDHIEGCAGADDNATGVAGVLELARVMASVDHGGTLVVACWDEEERGLVGSEAFVAQLPPVVPEVAFVFEMIGYASDESNSQQLPLGFEILYPEQVQEVATDGYRGDFIAWIADPPALPATQRLAAHATARELDNLVLEVPTALKTSETLSDLRRSDHASFWDADLPAVMITDTSEFRYAQYHCRAGPDVVELLDHDFATRVVSATVGATADLLGVP